MSNNRLALGVSLAAVVFCGAAYAGPKPAHPKVKPAPARRVPTAHLRLGYANPGDLIAHVPNMTQMPDSHLVGGLQTGRSSPIYTDTQGRAIGRMDLRGRAVWFRKPTARNARPR